MNAPFSALRIDPDSELTIVGQIRAQVTLLIADGRVPPGSRLPSVRAIADHLGVNVNTARSAYARLESDGLVTTRHGVGTTVLQPAGGRPAPTLAGFGSNTVGVVIAGLDPFYLDLLRGIEAKANEQGTLLFIVDAADSHDRARVAIQQLTARGALGVIAIHLGDAEGSGIDGGAIPIVFVDQPDRGGPSVLCNAEKAGYDATKHLIEHGHRQIGYLSCPLYWPNQKDLLAGYRRALREHGITVRSDRRSTANGFTVDEGRRGLRALFDHREPPSAVLASGGMLALGILKEARELGLDVPASLAVVGFADTQVTQYTQPALTMVSLPLYDMGAAAMDVLRAVVADPAASPARMMFDGVLVVRESCGEHPVG